MPTLDLTPMHLAEAMTRGPADAIKFMAEKGYLDEAKLPWKWTDVWQEAHARAFVVTGVTKLDVLKDLHTGLIEALKTGSTEQQFANVLTPVLKQTGWWGRNATLNPDTGEISGKGLTRARLGLIYRQNLQTSYMAGRYQQMKAASDTHPNWQYIAVMDGKTRPSHSALHGRVFRHDDPIIDSIFPPNGFNCRCRMTALSDYQMERDGLSVTDSRDDTREVTVPKSARHPEDGTTQVTQFQTPDMKAPFRVDAGFNYNAARAIYQPQLDAYPFDTARQYVHGSLTGPAFAQTYQRIDAAVTAERARMPDTTNKELRATLTPTQVQGDQFPVAVVSEEVRELLGSKTSVVLLSDDTLLKQIINRTGQDIVLADYWKVQDVLEAASLIVAAANQHYLFFRRGTETFVAVIKLTTKNELYLQSFRRSSTAAARQIMKKGSVIKGGM